VINGTNLFGKDNPRWLIGNMPETVKFQAVGSPGSRGPVMPGRGGRPPDLARTFAAAFRTAAVFRAGRPTGILHRAGKRLFASADEEARWRGWQITELRSGLARHYRDAYFDVLHLIRDIDDSAQEPGTCPVDGDC
jgi:hypothetical protein